MAEAIVQSCMDQIIWYVPFVYLILIELVIFICIYIFIYVYVYYNLPNGCKDLVENW